MYIYILYLFTHRAREELDRNGNPRMRGGLSILPSRPPPAPVTHERRTFDYEIVQRFHGVPKFRGTSREENDACLLSVCLIGTRGREHEKGKKKRRKRKFLLDTAHDRYRFGMRMKASERERKRGRDRQMDGCER